MKIRTGRDGSPQESSNASVFNHPARSSLAHLAKCLCNVVLWPALSILKKTTFKWPHLPVKSLPILEMGPKITVCPISQGADLCV